MGLGMGEEVPRRAGDGSSFTEERHRFIARLRSLNPNSTTGIFQDCCYLTFLVSVSSVCKVVGYLLAQSRSSVMCPPCALAAYSCSLPGPASFPLCPDVSSSPAAGHARTVRRAAAPGAGAAAVAACPSPTAQCAATCPGGLLQVLLGTPRPGMGDVSLGWGVGMVQLGVSLLREGSPLPPSSVRGVRSDLASVAYLCSTPSHLKKESDKPL